MPKTYRLIMLVVNAWQSVQVAGCIYALLTCFGILVYTGTLGLRSSHRSKSFTSHELQTDMAVSVPKPLQCCSPLPWPHARQRQNLLKRITQATCGHMQQSQAATIAHSHQNTEPLLIDAAGCMHDEISKDMESDVLAKAHEKGVLTKAQMYLLKHIKITYMDIVWIL